MLRQVVRLLAEILAGIGVGMEKWLAAYKSCNIYETGRVGPRVLHCVSKNDPNLKQYSSKFYGLILMIFGRNIQTSLE